MPNRVRYYITESDNQPVVRSVPVKICAQPANDLMEIERHADVSGVPTSSVATPVGRIVKVLRKPAKAHTS